MIVAIDCNSEIKQLITLEEFLVAQSNYPSCKKMGEMVGLQNYAFDFCKEGFILH